MARLLDRDVTTIRRLEKQGRIPKARRDPVSNHRYWVVDEIEDALAAFGVSQGEAGKI